MWEAKLAGRTGADPVGCEEASLRVFRSSRDHRRIRPVADPDEAYPWLETHALHAPERHARPSRETCPPRERLISNLPIQQTRPRTVQLCCRALSRAGVGAGRRPRPRVAAVHEAQCCLRNTRPAERENFEIATELLPRLIRSDSPEHV